MTESTWHASCLKHHCLTAMVSFDSDEPVYHRISPPHECACAVGTLVIHHMSHSPLESTKDAEQQIGAMRKALSTICSKTAIPVTKDGDFIQEIYEIADQARQPGAETDNDHTKVAEQRVGDFGNALSRLVKAAETIRGTNATDAWVEFRAAIKDAQRILSGESREDRAKVVEQQVCDLKTSMERIASLLSPQGPRRIVPLANLDEAKAIADQAASHRTHDLRQRYECVCGKDPGDPVCVLHPVRIQVNGRERRVGWTLTYEDAVRISQLSGADLYTVTWCIIGQNRGGTLTPGQSVQAKAGMSVDVCFTGNA